MIEFLELGSPKEFWEYFYKISQIPRCSARETRIREYIKKEALRFGFEAIQDRGKNLLVRIPANNTGNSQKTVIIQSHLDMVCEKKEDVVHDFSQDPLKLKVIEIEGDSWITAEGTTLGADNGIGTAYQLALMKKIYKNELKFGPLALELLFTVNEEYGMTGAKQIDRDLFKGRYLINTDCGDDRILIIGSAGSIEYKAEVKFKREVLSPVKDEYISIDLSIKGLLGGHSGADITKGRANAIKLIVELLWNLNRKHEIYLKRLHGGQYFNAIPREASARFIIKKEEASLAREFLKQIISKALAKFESVETNFILDIQESDEISELEYIPPEVQDKILDVLLLLPNGPISFFSRDMNIPLISSNIGMIRTKKGRIRFESFQRGLSNYENEIVFEGIKDLLAYAGFKTQVYDKGSSWLPDYDSNLLEISKKVYKHLFNEEPKIKVLNIVLECGHFKENLPDLDIISFGATHVELHSPDERLKVKSVNKTWRLLLAILNEIAKT